MSKTSPFDHVHRVVPVGPRSWAKRVGLAGMLALAGLTGVAMGYAPDSVASTRNQQAVQGDVQALSISGWTAKLQREGHSLQDAALLTQAYRRLAAPTLLGRVRLDQESAQWLNVRTHWRQRFEQPLSPPQGRSLIAALNADVVSRCGCGPSDAPSENVLNTLGFSSADWDQIVRRQDVTQAPRSWGELAQINEQQSAIAWRWDGRQGQHTSLASMSERQHAQARLEAHARNLNVSWVRVPWGTLDDINHAQSVERGLVGMHTAMQHITTWNEPAVGLKGRLRWDISQHAGSADTQVRVDNGAVWVQAPIHEFPARWFDAVQTVEPVSPRIERSSQRMQRRFVSDNALADLLTAAVNGRTDRALDRMANRAIRAAPRALLGGGNRGRPTGQALARIDSAVFSNDMHAIAPHLFALSEAPQPRGTHLSREDWAASLDSVRSGLHRLDDNGYAPSCQRRPML